MCLILLALGMSPEFPLLIAANRDELYARPTAPAQWWDEPCRWLGGRDSLAGGTWLGVTPSRRFAAVTNYRDPAGHKGVLSRGQLVLDALCGEPDLEGDYSDYNLLWGTPDEVWYRSSREGPPRRVEPGYHGLSNHLLDTRWPKVGRGLVRLGQAGFDLEAVFAVLGDRTVAPDMTLPDTGVGLELERALSPAYIETPLYGTRSSTVVLFGHESVRFVERSSAGERAFEY